LNAALATMLASLALLGLGIFGPGIATGLVSGAPQLGAGAAAGTAIGAVGLGVAGGAAVAGAGRFIGRGAGIAGASATSLSAHARDAYSEGKAASGHEGLRGAGAGVANVLRSGVDGAVRRMRPDGAQGADGPDGGSAANAGERSSGTEPGSPGAAPAWAASLTRRGHVAQGATTAAHVLRGADHGGGGLGPRLDHGEGESS
ncbi:MAG: P-type conjugative transfer protein TrbL, partial [Casimicrobiaceae bacterium]